MATTTERQSNGKAAAEDSIVVENPATGQVVATLPACSPEQLVEMAKGDGQQRTVPALVFCFNRDECWSVAEHLKGLPLVPEAQKPPLHAEVNKLDWTQGVGPKMKQMLHRGVGVHHAGLLPKYRRVVEELFLRKMLACVICTETLASGKRARSGQTSSLKTWCTTASRPLVYSTARFESPPPSTITDGSRTLMTLASARPKRVQYPLITAAAVASPAAAAAAISAASRAGPPAARYAPSSAGPESSISTHPRCPQ